MAATLQWRRILDECPRSGSANMALDHALASRLGPDEAVLRLYRWKHPTVSLGRNEPAAGVYDARAAAAEGIAFVRRPTGGRAVLHDAEVTYAVVLPLRALGGLRPTYLRIHEGIVLGLRALGADAGVAEDGVALPPDAGPCFRSPAPGEIVAGDRKLVGSAQMRLGEAILQHGSVILDGDQATLNRLGGGAHDRDAPATLSERVGPVSWLDAARAVASGLGLALPGAWTDGGYAQGEIREAERLEQERYGSDAWTWRR